MQTPDRRANRSLAARNVLRLCGVLCAGWGGLNAGCNGDVSLGAWRSTVGGIPSSITSTQPTVVATEAPSEVPAESAVETQMPPPPPSSDSSMLPDAQVPTAPLFPECYAMGGALSPLSTPVSTVPDATQLVTDWALPHAANSLEWDLMIEKEIPARSPTEPATFGYYWQQQFTFDSGVSVQAGLQAEGALNQVPGMMDKLTDFTKLAVFWISGVEIQAELGSDFAAAESRVGPQETKVQNYMTIHVKYRWEVCHQYHFRFAPEQKDGETWYALSIEDRTVGTKVTVGRMRLSTDPGLLTPSVTSKTVPVTIAHQNCSQVIPSSAIWGAPSVDGAEYAGRPLNRYAVLACGRARATTFASAVRHEAGIVQ